MNTASPDQAALDTSVPSFSRAGWLLLAFVPLALISAAMLRTDRRAAGEKEGQPPDGR